MSQHIDSNGEVQNQKRTEDTLEGHSVHNFIGGRRQTEPVQIGEYHFHQCTALHLFQPLDDLHKVRPLARINLLQPHTTTRNRKQTVAMKHDNIDLPRRTTRHLQCVFLFGDLTDNLHGFKARNWPDLDWTNESNVPSYQYLSSLLKM